MGLIVREREARIERFGLIELWPTLQAKVDGGGMYLPHLRDYFPGRIRGILLS
jgi:hypothetical protein